jgi:hypothetical protein
MDFMPAFPLTSFPAHLGHGDIAMDFTGTLLASVDYNMHCVRIYRVDGAGECGAAAVVACIPGTAGRDDKLLSQPTCACFVHRHGLDTLLICDSANDRVVEVTVDGAFIRTLAVRNRSCLSGIAFCQTSDVIAVSLEGRGEVLLLHFKTGEEISEATIRSNRIFACTVPVFNPMGVAFTADGLCLSVADCRNHRVSKFSTVTGAFIAHVATKATHGIWYPKDVQWCEDGSLVIAQQGDFDVSDVAPPSVVCGVKRKEIKFPSYSSSSTAAIPSSLSFSASLNAVVVKMNDGNIFLLYDAFGFSSRGCLAFSRGHLLNEIGPVPRRRFCIFFGNKNIPSVVVIVVAINYTKKNPSSRVIGHISITEQQWLKLPSCVQTSYFCPCYYY